MAKHGKFRRIPMEAFVDLTQVEADERREPIDLR